MIRILKSFALHLPSLSIGLTFMTLSLLFGSWLARLPEIQMRLALSEGQLGLALLGLPLGALALIPFTTYLSTRLTTGNAMSISTILLCLAAPLPSMATDIWGLVAMLFLLGLANSFMNISMNAAAAAVESTYNMSIMSTCHGMFSLGAMIGAGTSGIAASASIPFHYHMMALALVLILLQLTLRPNVMHLPNHETKSTSLALPPPAIWGLAFIGFCIMIGEGAVADWGAIYLSKEMQADPFVASLGYAGFSLMMAVGRFGGDGIKQLFGTRLALIRGSLIGATGVLIAILSPFAWMAVLGFALVGLGFSIVVPLLFSAAAQTPGVAPSAGIAAIATSGIIGFLLAPPIIGILSEHLGLGMGLGIVAILALAAALVAWRRG